MCKYMGVRHATTVAYHSRSNGGAELAGREVFENSGNCILKSLADIGIIPFKRFCGHTTISPDCLVGPPIASYSCRIKFHVLSRG